MLRVKGVGLNFQKQSNKGMALDHLPDDWEVEQIDAPFDCFTVHINSQGKLNRVASVDDVADQFLEGGGSIIRDKLVIPGVAALICCEDCSGHVFSFIEEY